MVRTKNIFFCFIMAIVSCVYAMEDFPLSKKKFDRLSPLQKELYFRKFDHYCISHGIGTDHVAHQVPLANSVEQHTKEKAEHKHEKKDK